MGKLKGRKVLVRKISSLSIKQAKKVAARLPSLSSEEYSVVTDKSLPPDVAPVTVVKTFQIDRKKWSDLHKLSQINVSKSNQSIKRVNVQKV